MAVNSESERTRWLISYFSGSRIDSPTEMKRAK